MRTSTWALLLFCFTTFLSATTFAQQFTTEGKEFWFGFMQNTLGSPPDTLMVSMSSRFNASATVSIPLSGWSQSVTIPANTSVTVGIPKATAMASGCGAMLPMGCHIQSDQQISAYALNFQGYSADATLLIPNPTLGDKYYLNTYRENYSNSRQTQMLIVAAYPNTTIQITPSVATACGNPAGVPFQINLNQGQVYNLESNDDLTGTFVQSIDVGQGCKKFVLFSGNFCTAVGSQCCCDHLYDINFYNDSWGKNYILPNLRTRGQTRFRVVSQQNGTQVSVNGGPVQNINAGQYYQFDLSANGSLTSNNPVSVLQLSMSGDVDGSSADPFMILLGPNEQTLNEITFNTLFNSGNSPNYYATIVTKSNSTGLITLDGAPITGFVPVASNPAYSIASPTVAYGSHTIKSDSGFLAYIYEYASYESFGYSAGANLSNLFANFEYASSRFDSIFCPGDTVFFQGIGDPSILSYEWDFGDGDTARTQNPHHVYTALGDFTVKMIIQRQNSCDKDTIPGNIKILGPPITDVPDDSICIGSSITVAVTSTDSIRWSTGDTAKSITLSPTVTTSYSVYAKNVACAGMPDTFTIKVRDPKVDFTTSPKCFGNPIRFTPSASTSLQYFSWDFGDGNVNSYTSAILNYTDHTYASAGTFQVTLAVIDSFGCKDTVRQNVSVFPLLNQDFTVNDVCFNGTANVINNTTVVSGSIQNQWIWGDGSTNDTAFSPTHVYTTVDTFTITYIAVTDSGCSDTLTKQIIVYDTASVDFTATDTCLGNSTVFNVSSSAPPGSTPFWDFGDGIQSSDTFPIHTYAAPGVYTVTSIIITPQGCNDTLAQQVEVFPKPLPDFVADSTCDGDSLTFTNLSSIASGTYTNMWDLGDGNTSTDISPTHLYAAYGNYTVKLVLTSDKNCLDSITKVATVNPNPTAAFTINDVCNDSTLTASNTSSVPSGTLSYNWNWGDGDTSSIVPASHNYSSSGTYTVSVTVTTNKGCVDTTSQTATVILGSVTDFSIPEVCETAPSIFTDLSVLKTGTTVASYAWDFGDGNTAATQNTSHTYATYGNYNVKLVLDYGNNCFDSITKVATVNPNPTAAFTINDVCNDSTLAASNTSSVPSGTLSYNWNWGDGDTSSIVPASHNYSSSGTYTVSVTVTTNKGCVDTASQTATVILGSVMDFSIPEVCETAPSIFTDLSVLKTGTTVASYAWDFGDGNTAATQNTSHTYATYGNYNVKLVLDYGNSCFDSITKVATVNPNPTAAFTINDVCNDSTLAASNTSSVPSGTLSYNWNWGDGDTSSIVPASHNYSSSGTYTVSVTVTTNKGCVDTASQTATVILGSVMDFSIPELCETAPSIFTDLSVLKTGTTVASYAWDFGDGNTAATQNTSHTYATYGNYNVKLVLDYGNSCFDSITKVATVHQNPTAAFTSTTVCENNYTNFTNNSSPAGLAYTWNFGDGNTSTNDNPTHLYAGDGIYPVVLVATSTAQCSDTITDSVTVLTVGEALFSVAPTCLGNASLFVNQTDTVLYPTANFTWFFGDGSTSNQSTPQKQYTNTGNFNITMIANFANSCADTAYGSTSVFEIPAFTAQTKNVSCFSQNDGEITLQATAGKAPFNYTWVPALSNSAIQTNVFAGKYVVTFSDANSCSDTLSVTITQPDSLSLYIAVDSISCFGRSDGKLRAFATGGTPQYSYVWSNGVHQHENANLKEGDYTVTVSDANLCELIRTVLLPNPVKFAVNLVAEDTIQLGEDITLTPTYNYSNITHWQWTPATALNCIDCENPIANPYNDIVYTVYATTEKGCIDSAYTRINVEHNPVVYVPNLFTPNNDGLNDIAMVYANNVMDLEFLIFNRWGEKVYEGHHINEGWNGFYQNKLQEPETYVYVVTVTFLNNKKVTKTGSITLVK